MSETAKSVPIMLRVDPDLASGIHARAHAERRSINSMITAIVRDYVTAQAQPSQVSLYVHAHLPMLRAALRESQSPDHTLFQLLIDCISALSHEPGVIRPTRAGRTIAPVFPSSMVIFDPKTAPSTSPGESSDPPPKRRWKKE